MQPLVRLADYGVGVGLPADVTGNSVARAQEFKAVHSFDMLTTDA